MKNPIDIYSTKDYKKVEAVVQLMVDGKVTSYRVATETDISKMSLATLTKGTSKIKNITYQTAMLLIEWYDKNHEKYGITIDQQKPIFYGFSFCKKESTRKAVWIELWLDTSIHGLIFLKIKGSY